MQNLKEEIRNNMNNHCLDLEAWNWGLDDRIYDEKVELIEDEPVLIKRNNVVRELITKWEQVESKDWQDWNCEELNVEVIRKCFNIPENASVAIDLVLLFDDKEKVKNGDAIISMLLYDKLCSGGHSCILYSSYMYDSIFIDKWKEIYNKKRSQGLYEVDKIYSGRQMWEKAKKSDIIAKIKEIAREID